VNCPHCQSPNVHVNPRNAMMYFCQDCALPSIEENDGLVEIEERHLRENLISGKDRYAAFIWFVKVLTEKLTHKPQRAAPRT